MRLERRIFLGFTVVAALLILIGAFSYKTSQQSLVASHLVTHTNDVLFGVEQVLVASLNMETGQRGYELSGNESFLAPYREGIRVIPGFLNNIRELTKDNINQQKRIDTLTRIVNAKTSDFEKRTIAKGRKTIPDNHKSAFDGHISPATAMAARLINDREAMDHIRILTRAIENEETKLLVGRTEVNDRQIARINLLFISIISFIVLLTTIALFVINGNLKSLRTTESRLSSSRNLLQSSIESQKTILILSIDRNYNYLLFNTTYQESAMQLYKIQVHLGMNLLECIPDAGDRQRASDNFAKAFEGESYTTTEEFGTVTRSYFETFYNPIFDDNKKIIGATAFSSDITERKDAEIHTARLTEDLRVANTELDAFCYSVSHDLRAPLRSINGFARIILEDNGKQIDDAGHEALNTVINNARRMGQLIDDLLNFSKIGKTKLTHSKLEMEMMVKATVDEQLHSNAGSNAVVEIKSLPSSVGDPSLMKQVWANLISNAFKYSSKLAHPLIEIGSKNENGEVIYYIKDNGVGFDMVYAHKLFGVFQRLHKSSEFEGTGVGLSLVSRIIHRHHGRVWAEAKPNEGATFFFSLPS